MLHLITGVPGATKTAFCVTTLDKVEKSNKVNLVKNLEIYKHNQPLIEKFREDFTYREYEVGSGHELKRKIDILSDDYFDFLGQEFDDLRPDFYFQRVVHFNEIIERITKRDGEQNFKQFLPVRTIYTNINALKIDYARALTYDWRECPDGSIIVIDEVQLVKPYDSIKDKDNPIIQDLTIHRHRGFDFYFITQYPSLLHPTVKVLIGVHYHLTRPYGMKTVVYQYGSCKDNPNAMVNKVNREAKFFFTPQDYIFKLYKSTTINTHKQRFPKGIWFFVFWVVAGIVFFIWNISSFDIQKSTFFEDSNNPKKAQQPQTQSQINQAQDKKQKTEQPTINQPTPPTPEQIQKALHEKYLQSYTVEVAQDDVIRPALVAQMGNECKAYNQYGDLLNIDDKLCKSMLKEYGTKPRARRIFNEYQAQNSQLNATELSPTQADKAVLSPSQETIKVDGNL